MMKIFLASFVAWLVYVGRFNNYLTLATTSQTNGTQSTATATTGDASKNQNQSVAL
jgi:hypothetical protein